MTDAFTTGPPYERLQVLEQLQATLPTASDDRSASSEHRKTKSSFARSCARPRPASESYPWASDYGGAQLGHDWRPFYQDNEYIDDLPAAYSPERMKPLQDRAAEGRANPERDPGPLPVDTSQDRHVRGAAMARLTRLLRSLQDDTDSEDCRFFGLSWQRFHPVLQASPTPRSAKRQYGPRSTGPSPNPRTPADETADYVPTQVIAELFKNEGFDGIAYKSAFGKKGYNIVLFDPADAELTSCALFEAKSLKFRFEQSDNPYWVDADGATKTTSVTDVRPLPPAENTDP